MTQPKRRRRRGVILTEIGLNKLLNAKTEAEFANNRGNRYTRECLSERTGLSVDTCDKILDNEIPVDKNSLKEFFNSFNLTLDPEDYKKPDLSAENDESNDFEPELPDGQVPLSSPFYVERSPIEQDCYKTILQPGALLRLKAPRRTGKSSLMMRILDYARNKQAKSAYISLSLADKEHFRDLESFLKWFCAFVGFKLDLPNRLNDYWDEIFGSKISCQCYFEQYLLASLSQPLVLGLDDVDYLFQYPDLADDFFGLLRVWHEEGKNREIWRNLRLIVAHSTEVYIPLNVNQSPFNVGIPIELPEFTPLQVQNLAQRYQLNWILEDAEELMSLVGGNPYLIRWSLYHLKQEEMSLKDLLEDAVTAPDSIYIDHLRRQLVNLQKQSSSLMDAFVKVVMADVPVDLDLILGFKLQSLGLVQLKNNQVIPSCPLYGQYFRRYFQENPLTRNE
jgi:hypothetical protein